MDTNTNSNQRKGSGKGSSPSGLNQSRSNASEPKIVAKKVKRAIQEKASGFSGVAGSRSAGNACGNPSARSGTRSASAGGQSGSYPAGSTTGVRSTAGSQPGSRPSGGSSYALRNGKRKKKGRLRIGRLMMLVVPAVLIPVLLVWGIYRTFVPLKLKANEYLVQYQVDSFEPLDNVKSLFLGNKKDIEITGSADASKIGEYAMVYTYKGKQYPFVVKVADTKGPDLQVQDVSTDTVSEVSADNFIKSVSDVSEYSVKLDNPETEKKAGKTKVTITATDSYGNSTTKKANLIRKKDNTGPVIEEFADAKTVLQGDSFIADKYAAVDELDPSPVVDVDASAVNMDVPGDYQVSYTAKDRSGNTNVYTQVVTVQETPDYGKKVAYFTFDDGPSENTMGVLDALDQFGAKATFFVTGLNPDYYDLMKEIVNRGHTIALHTYTHDYGYVYASEENYFEDLQKISDLVQEETGIVADCIRFPGGSSNMVSSDYKTGIMTDLVMKVRDKGYQYFDWNADSTDASGQNVPAATIAANAISYIGDEDVNLLFHDASGKETTVEALPQILKAYQDAGYVFRGVRAAGFAPHHDVNN